MEICNINQIVLDSKGNNDQFWLLYTKTYYGLIMGCLVHIPYVIFSLNVELFPLRRTLQHPLYMYVMRVGLWILGTSLKIIIQKS